MTRVRSYRDLRVYQEAFRLAMEIFRVSRSFPDEEKFDLVRQIRRSSRSVCANTAEAWRRRRYPAALVAKLIDAEAEATETRVHLEFAEACGYLSRETVSRLDIRYDALLARLSTMRARPDRWIPSARVPTALPPRGKADEVGHRAGHPGHTRKPDRRSGEEGSEEIVVSAADGARSSAVAADTQRSRTRGANP